MRPLPTWFPLAVALLVGLLVRATPAQDEAALVSSFQAAFRKPNTVKTLADKRMALRALSGLDSAKVANALIRGFGHLEHEAVPLRASRRALLFRDGGSAGLWPLQGLLRRSSGFSSTAAISYKGRPFRPFRTDDSFMAHLFKV